MEVCFIVCVSEWNCSSGAEAALWFIHIAANKAQKGGGELIWFYFW
jgi:hypothetical protein